MYAEDVLRLSFLLTWDREEAKDILQETLLRLVRMIKEGKLKSQNGSLKGLLLQVARNLCIDHLRSKKNFISLDDIGDWAFDPKMNDNRPDRVVERKDRECQFFRALKYLTDTQRTILVLHDYHHESYEEIARTLGLTVNNVRTHLWRARERLRQILQPLIEDLP